MCKNKKEIILFIDNCKDYGIFPEMTVVKVVFLPPNTTSKLQPLDLVLIRSFKVGYRMVEVKKIVDTIDRKEEITPLSILDCMRKADRVRENVTQKTIVNCFRTGSFVKEVENEIKLDEE